MKLEFYTSLNHNPHHNLALEKHLMESCPEATIRFYLWQNEHTVVIGKNQSAQSEVHLAKLKEDKGTLARRTSGGGAVYHDLGNLNFSFIGDDSVFDIPKQMHMIAQALCDLGYNAQVNGRNDIEVDGAKVSGNAFAHQGGIHLHHGTLLVNVDKAKLGLYLNVNPKKLKRKNVASVAARITNLNEIKPITIDNLKTHLFDTMEKVYKVRAQFCNIPFSFDPQLVESFSNETWLYNLHRNEKVVFSECFDFGCVEWQMDVKNGLIQDNHLYTDAMDTEWSHKIENCVLGIEASEAELTRALSRLNDPYVFELIKALQDQGISL